MDRKELSMYFRKLAVLNETNSSVISCCSTNNEASRANSRNAIDARAHAEAKGER